MSTDWMVRALHAAREVDPPDWLIGAGAIHGLVWGGRSSVISAGLRGEGETADLISRTSPKYATSRHRSPSAATTRIVIATICQSIAQTALRPCRPRRHLRSIHSTDLHPATRRAHNRRLPN
jgi:hypothetical protein